MNNRGIAARWGLIGILVGLIGGILFLYLGLRTLAGNPAPGTGPTSFVPQQGVDVASRILDGGYILYFRHGNRVKWDSVIAFDVYETATGVDSREESFRDAVCLSPQGIEEAKMIGEIMELGRVPVGFVAASPSCRARETAEFAFARVDAIETALVHTPVTSATNQATFTDALGEFLRTVPMAADNNTFVMAHGNTLENHPELFASGADWLREPFLLESGFYAISRSQDGKLAIEYQFTNLGEFAATVITLDPDVQDGP